MVVDGVRIRLTPGLVLSERVAAAERRPRRLAVPPAPRPFGLHRHPVDLRRRIPPQFALQVRGARHVVPRARERLEQTFLLLPGVVAVYGGMILFIRVWFGLVQTLRHGPGAPIRTLAAMLALWIVPCSWSPRSSARDVFSYAAQGEMMSHHINPYNYGPGTIGSGPYVTHVRRARVV